MDLTSKELLPTEEPMAQMPEQDLETLEPPFEDPCEPVQDQETPAEWYKEPPADHSYEDRPPCGEEEPSYPYQAPPKENHSNPYARGYYSPAYYGRPYGQGQMPCFGGGYVPLNREAAYEPPTSYTAPKPVVVKNKKPVGSLILGLLAMGILNYMPFVALVLSIIAICTGYTGLKEGELTKGKRICGYIGLALGVIGLVLSVTMLITLLTLIIRANKELFDSAQGLYR